jgi:tetratricopeptide (TPR) repeat protein
LTILEVPGMSLFGRTPPKKPASTTAEDLVARGTALARQGDFTGAIRCFDGALRLQPADSGTWIRRGNACRDLGDSIGAIASYDEAIRLRPGISAPWTLKGNVLKDQGSFRDAIECYDTALEVHPENLVAGTNRAVAIRALRRSMTAEEWVDWGLLYFFRGQYVRANECYDIALALDPANAVALENKVSLLDKQGMRSETIDCEDQVIELDRGRG